MSSLTVLCPNARRQVVKAQANTKILEILEEVCKRQGLDPNQHDLVFQKKHLDVTLTYRLSGVPNNAQLELVRLENGPRQISDISICLQLDDGTRLPVRQFKPDVTSVLAVLEAYSDVGGERIKRAIDGAGRTEMRPLVSYLNDQIVGHYQMKNTSLLDMGLASGRFVLRLGEKSVGDQEMASLEAEFRAKLEKKSKLDEIYAKKQSDLAREGEKSATNDVEIVEVVRAYEKTERQEPKRVKIDDNVPVEPPKPIRNRPCEKPREELARENEFQNFKFPEETRGQNLIEAENELETMERESREACDRIAVRFSAIESRDNVESAASAGNEIDDEFFNVTVDDLRSRLSDLKKVQNDEAPLMTRQMREMERDRRAMKYSKVVVRVSFKSGTIIQGLFRPKEPISHLYKFVKSCLSTKDSHDFKLFVSPPKKILSDMKQTLFDAGLCPASIVYFKSSAPEEPELNPDIRAVTMDEANEIVVVNVHQTMRQFDHEGFKWLEKENSLVQNILKNSSLRDQSGPSSRIDYEQSDSRPTTRPNQDPARSKIEKFLGFKK